MISQRDVRSLHSLSLATFCEKCTSVPCGCAQGKYHVPYFTAKARVMEYVAAKYPDMKAVFPSPAYFYTNFMQYYHPKCVTETYCCAPDPHLDRSREQL